MLAADKLSADTELLLGEIRRLGELTLRLAECGSEPTEVREIAAQVAGIEPRLFLAAVHNGRKG